MCVCVCVCLCFHLCVYNSCFIQSGLEIFYKVFSFIWNNVLSLIWYMGITLNLPWLHSYSCFDTFTFLFSGIFILLLWSDILALKACIDPMYISLHLLHSIMLTMFFWVAAYIFIYSEFCFWVFKGIRFSFHNYITYSTSFFLAFGNSLYCVSPECWRGEYSFNIFELSLTFNDFCCI